MSFSIQFFFLIRFHFFFSVWFVCIACAVRFYSLYIQAYRSFRVRRDLLLCHLRCYRFFHHVGAFAAHLNVITFISFIASIVLIFCSLSQHTPSTGSPLTASVARQRRQQQDEKSMRTK